MENPDFSAKLNENPKETPDTSFSNRKRFSPPIDQPCTLFFMKKIETEISILASPNQVWDVLTDFARYPDWNTFVRSIQGEKKVGGWLEVQIQPPGGSGMTFRPEVLRFDAEKEFRWKGKLFVKGIFDGEHYFILQKKGEKETRLIHGEIFSGFLVGVLSGMLSKTEAGFKLMNEALKTECEKQAQ